MLPSDVVMNSVPVSLAVDAVPTTRSRWVLLRYPVSTLWLGSVVTLYFLLMLNTGFFTRVLQVHVDTGLHYLLFLGSVVVFAGVLINALISLFAFRFTFKPWLILLLLTGSAASYFITSYNVVMDRDMIRNVFETDWREVLELLNGKLVLHLLFLGVLPSLLIALTPVRYGAWWREVLNKGVVWVISLLVIATIALLFYQDYASLFRNDRKLKNYLVPSGYLYSLVTFSHDKLKTRNIGMATLGIDAHPGALWKSADQRKKIVVLVVGETARADNFALNGYDRDTNPELQHEDIIYYDHVHSCGTSTAASLPCMFSPDGRHSFDAAEAEHSENLLDVVAHAGLDVLWRDNNSGCKGLCNRVPFEDLSQQKLPDLCEGDECFDMVLLHELEQRISAMPQGGLIVLHQKGSHGPAYYLRTPRDFQRFSPICHTNQLQQCTQAEIVNAYDNTILYTDHVLAQLIERLRQNSSGFDSALLYVSDHGESLSESNLYLHGIPYAIAPEQQTHVPMLMWMSDQFAHERGIDQHCLREQRQRPYSHDNLFDTVLDLLDVKTTVLHPTNSLLEGCRREPG